MKATIYDVAKAAGVSIATVSKVINNTGNMRDTTRQKVKETMEKLNYQPSLMASALTGKGTETLGLLVPDISNPFFSEIAKTIEDRAHESGMSVIICSTDENTEKEKKYVELLQRKQVDGMIVASSFHNIEILKGVVDRKIPLVMLTQDDAGLGVTSISVDDFKGGYEATSHLLSEGHRDIVIIAEYAKSSKHRIYGYLEAHEEHGIKTSEENIIRTVASIENGRECLRKIVEKGKVPTGIFACNDLIAVGVIQEANEMGLNIPEDLSIVGFDNTILATTTVPGLTTIAQPITEMGKRVVDVIISEIKDKNQKKEHVLFKPQLIIRGTTAVKKR
ncbi:LacI family DNA-binding transcriptional regulator [Lederbergia wuyishanensis]|uniref:DNA-binding LacI/PurR family transcriptional regulator n=1 Tax=Lederbergia wuyishanensis TaxID=1347903 RepID=A0ABU0D4A5_9BACI|nr:LacI family DNA-binding transcriptional regulator [Lederbergia wuyishanensis]MCJ8008192.1 LacI family transcriptional regulator [Lederbergia wuyishanensis]MDQ0343219.1 DNA-binding LacI/PurR family transcriptional regulator [Lederbergia wuyishanensis]